MPCPYASCNDCCIVHSTNASADPELVGGGGGWICMLLLHPIPTCANAGPDLCTLSLRWLSPAATYNGGIFPQPLAQRLHLHRGGFTHCNLRRWCFSFHPLVQIPDLYSGNLHCVVVIYIGLLTVSSTGKLRAWWNYIEWSSGIAPAVFYPNESCSAPWLSICQCACMSLRAVCLYCFLFVFLCSQAS